MHWVQAKSLLSSRGGMNLYRGCTHGCIYCDSRSQCYQMDHAFEDVAAKGNAPQLLQDALRRKRKKCMIATGAMSDPYLPLERELKLTRRCLKIIADWGFGLAIQSKSDLILRDLDLLTAIQRKAKCVVQITLTTFDESLCRVLEPNVCTTRRRLEVLETLRDHGIPTIVWLDPFLPFINDDEQNFSSLLQACLDVGVKGIICFGIGLTLREGNREYFYACLDKHFPGLRQKYVRQYGLAYEVRSQNHAFLMPRFHAFCEENGMLHDVDAIFRYLQTYEPSNPYHQISLFD